MQGEVIAGRFELLKQAGQGGMASVYRAHDHATQRIVAVKVLTLDRPFDIARFTREATVLATVRHPNIVDYIAHGHATGVHYLAQEWVDGEALGAYLRYRGATPHDAIVIAHGIANALGAIHALGVIHRDVKPANIIATSGKLAEVKLVDFGIARATSEGGLLTRTGVLVGTPSYMAPEQAQGVIAIGPTADVWALGCVLYEALTGRMAFAGRTQLAVRAKILLGAPLSLQPLCPEAPPALVALVAAMLNKEPAARPANGHAVAALLAALPELPDRPRRRSGGSELPTVASRPPVRAEHGAARVYVFLKPLDEPAEPTPRPAVHQVAAEHGLELHTFEDGAMLLVATQPGQAGAIEAARAAIELRDHEFDGSICVFGQAFSETLEDALERGSELLDRGTISTLFDGVIDSGEPSIQLDNVVAPLIEHELPVLATTEGLVLQTARERTGRG